MKTVKKSKLRLAAEKSAGQETVSSTSSGTPARPDLLFEMAKEEPDRRALDEYIQTIQLLRRKKRFTFREIADWLNANGVETDHNSVYRAYLRHVPEEQVEEFEHGVALEEMHQKGN